MLFTCPICKEELHAVFFGDDVHRLRCLKCDQLYDSFELLVSMFSGPKN